MNINKNKMTPKERINCYFKGEEVDRLPTSIMIEETAAVYAGINVKDYYFDADKMLEVEKFKVRNLGLDNSEIGVTLRGIGEALGSKLEYPSDRASYVVDPVLKDYKMLDNMKVINPYKDGRFPIILKGLGKIKKELGNEACIGSSIPGPMTAATSVRGIDNLMRDFIKNKEGVHNLLDFVTECNLVFAKAVYEEYGIVCGIGDPVCSGNLISYKQFEKIVEPYLRKTIDGIYEITGQKTSLYICGKTKQMWSSIGNMNIAGFSIGNYEDMGELKKELGNKVFIGGNVDPVSIIRNGTVQDVDKAVKSCIEKAADNPKGYIVGVGCYIPSESPIENIKTIIKATKKYSSGIRIGESI